MSAESHLPKLEDIPEIQAGLRYYLVNHLHVQEDRLEESFRNWCRNLGEGKAFYKDMRRFVIYTLLGAGYYQHQISKILNISLRTVGRDVKLIAETTLHSRFWKKGLLRPGKLRVTKEDWGKTIRRLLEDYQKKYGALSQ